MATDNAPIKSKPEWIVPKSFAAVILLGGILLATPYARQKGEWADFPGVLLDSLFTSTSATCVTGLTTVDPGTTYTHAGQLIVLLLIQMGGIGITTFGTFFLVAVGRRISMRDEFVLMDSLGHESVRGLKGLLAVTIVSTVLVEAVGAGILAYQFATVHRYGLLRAVYHGVFHAVSAFCNAGFALYPDNLIGLRTDKVLMLAIAGLIILGGLGFPVLYNIGSIKFWKKDLIARGRLTLHSRIVLVTSATLIVIGSIAILWMEWNQTLAGLDPGDKIVCAFFQSVTPRTAGFNAVDMSDVRPATLSLTTILMFIGGSPASAAGGIKTTTMLVLILTIVSLIRNREATEYRRKTIPMEIVREAIVIFVLSLFLVGAFSNLLMLTESIGPVSRTISGVDAIVFETVSAFGTVGLSTGITPTLSPMGKLCIICCMFVGRVGTLTVALIMATRGKGQVVRYPEEDVVVG